MFQSPIQKQQMGSMNALIFYLLLFFSIASNATTTKLFREYIGAEFNNVSFSNVPINPDVEFHFILSFAADYTNTKHPSPTNGKFNIFWDAKNLSPADVASLKRRHGNVRVAVSLAGDTVNGRYAYFAPESVSSWVWNAAASLTRIIRRYHLDGIDIDYEHFNNITTGPDTFAECIGQLITYLKRKNIISFASIAPYDDDPIQSHYMELWRRYHQVIDYVNFQFYAYDKGTNVSQFLHYFERQVSNYKGGQVLASFSSDDSGGLKPDDGFFEACEELKRYRKLGGIFVWSADDSKELGYRNEEWSQLLLASN